MLIVPLTGTRGGASPASRQMLVYAVSSNAAAQRELQEPTEKRHHVFVKGEHVIHRCLRGSVFSAGISCTDTFFFLVFNLKDLKAL